MFYVGRISLFAKKLQKKILKIFDNYIYIYIYIYSSPKTFGYIDIINVLVSAFAKAMIPRQEITKRKNICSSYLWIL